VPRLLSSSVSCAPPFDLGRCRVCSGSRPVSDGRQEFGGFLDRDLLVPWLLSHQWVVCALSAGPRRCRWGRLSPLRSSFLIMCSNIVCPVSHATQNAHLKFPMKPQDGKQQNASFEAVYYPPLAHTKYMPRNGQMPCGWMDRCYLSYLETCIKCECCGLLTWGREWWERRTCKCGKKGKHELAMSNQPKQQTRSPEALGRRFRNKAVGRTQG
jgi:hypothetical protein